MDPFQLLTVTKYDLHPSLLYRDEDQLKLIEAAGHLIYDYIHKDPLEIAEYYFNENIQEDVVHLLMLTLPHEGNTYQREFVYEIVNYALWVYFQNINPPRSYKNTFITKYKKNNCNLKGQIDYIRSIPQPDQRTEEWYLFRHNLITASSAWMIFDSPAAKNRIIYEKCKPLESTKFGKTNVDSAFHWGQKYEPLSVMVYEYNYNTKIEDFGCIKDSTYSFLGASPDGINTDENSPLFGRMLEIKNPISRIITGTPKKDYWIQMQLQMAVCDLNECDFLETKFEEYENEDEFQQDGSFYETIDGKLKGIILYFDFNGNPYYVYAPLRLEKEEYTKWEKEQFTLHSDKLWVRTIHWKLETYSCILVLRNCLWFQTAIQKIEDTWKIIEDERVTGCNHRAPVKKDPKISKTGCLVPMNRLFPQQAIESTSIIDLLNLKIRTESFDETKQKEENHSSNGILL